MERIANPVIYELKYENKMEPHYEGVQETHEKLSVVRNEAVKAFDEQSKALEEATNKINNHLKVIGGAK